MSPNGTPKGKMGRVGFEPSALTPPEAPISEDERTESGTANVKKPPEDRDLALVADRWASLPERIKEAVLAPVRGCQQEG